MKDPEALISALAHIERMRALDVFAVARAARIAKSHGIDGKRLREIVESVQIEERYSLPIFVGPPKYSAM
jgi:hypothetical protein